MTDGPASPKLGFSAFHKNAEELLAEVELSLNRLRYLDVRESEHLISEVQIIVDQIRCELRDFGKN
jgi:hypothetical protein